MPRENVEIVRKLYESLNRRDWDGLRQICDVDVEFRGTIGGLEEARLMRGIEGLKRVTEQEDSEIWDEHVTEPQKLTEVGDQVLVIQREYQRGKSSGVDVVVDLAVVFDLRDGRIVRAQPYMDPAAAIKAVGLSEREAHADASEDALLE
jgi:ketosteroid isomerase-like protein